MVVGTTLVEIGVALDKAWFVSDKVPHHRCTLNMGSAESDVCVMWSTNPDPSSGSFAGAKIAAASLRASMFK